MIEIKNRHTGKVIHSGDFNSIKECVEDAVKKGDNLWDANLRDADLRDADLQDAYLQDAYLQGADLRDADLQDADLQDAYLQDAYLRDANLRGAYLGGVKNALQWQSPSGEKRICYSVKHSTSVYHKLGCFWGDTSQAINAIREKYGDNSLYEKYVKLAEESLLSETPPE